MAAVALRLDGGLVPLVSATRVLSSNEPGNKFCASSYAVCCRNMILTCFRTSFNKQIYFYSLALNLRQSQQTFVYGQRSLHLFISVIHVLTKLCHHHGMYARQTELLQFALKSLRE